MTSPEVAAAVEQVFDEFVAEGDVPGLVFGVVQGGELTHSRGYGCLDLGSAPDEAATPDERTVFRIASMTKSFTAATALSLRDEGLLQLDRVARDYVPELTRGHPFNQEITVRQLLTMRSGFPTDDPWGDRQQALEPSRFSDQIGNGLQPMWRPGERFEYSNLGYALLGKVIETCAQRPFRDVVNERVFVPLSMTRSGFDLQSLSGAAVSTGYVRRGDEYVVEPIDGYGAFASMGGILSCVEDLSTWVAAFLGSHRDLDAGSLRASSLRELQSGHTFVEAVSHPLFTGRQAPPTVRHYGMGLFEDLLPEGRTVWHSGGYPGFGSHMRWHPDTDLGVIALGNRTYAPVGKAAGKALTAAVKVALGGKPRSATPHTRLAQARSVVETLLNEWDNDLVRRWFTDNVGQDEPWHLREDSAEEIAARHGRLSADPDHPPRVVGPAHTEWWLVGAAGGRVKVELLFSPHVEPLIQWVRWTSVPEPSAGLVSAARSALRAMDPEADLGAPTAGDGTSKATFAATSPNGPIEVDVPPSGSPRVRRSRLVVEPRC